MGSPRVTPQEIAEMHRLYAIYDTYSAVALETGRHPTTVARYIKPENIPNNIRMAVQNLMQTA